ncbi:MAG: phosphatidylserine decarboxylase family protein [Deltaproteobacteria bacterium]|nr:phosphatidylserine decarboxylase family protein [Deltaproteobacteria bacterium]
MVSQAGHREPIAREGLVFIVPPVIVSTLCWWFGYPWISLFFLTLSVAIALFFRNPERIPPEGEGIVLSPADGRVVEMIENAKSEYLPGDPLKRISIFMSIFNTHVNRCPISGTVTKITYVPGRFLDAREAAASNLNEHNSLVLKGHEFSIEVVQIAGKIARRIACWIREGDEVRQGDRFGLVRFGSRLDVYLPQNCTLEARIGDRVRAGLTIIAKDSTTPG